MAEVLRFEEFHDLPVKPNAGRRCVAVSAGGAKVNGLGVDTGLVWPSIQASRDAEQAAHNPPSSSREHPHERRETKRHKRHALSPFKIVCALLELRFSRRDEVIENAGLCRGFIDYRVVLP